MLRAVRRGMTLVELLVVIAIIVLLMALLVPVALRARGSARRAHCQNNLSQLAKAVQQFANENSQRLPVYYGVQTGQGGDKFGGWLLHLLPYLDQLALYDKVPGSATMTMVVTGWTPVMTGSTPSIPASDDYNPGTYVRVKVGEQIVNQVTEEIFEWRLEGRKGTPASGGAIWELRPNAPVPATNTNGLTQELLNIATDVSAALPFLWDTEDTSALRAPLGMLANGAVSGMQLTNYFANAHVFTKLAFEPTRSDTDLVTIDHRCRVCGRYSDIRSSQDSPCPTANCTGRLNSSTRVEFGRITFYEEINHVLYPQAGKFPMPLGSRGGAGQTLVSWTHNSGTSAVTGTNSVWPLSRSITPGHIPDGLANTILFAEGRRQCAEPAESTAGGRAEVSLYRTAFFPSGLAGHEHGFGIECLMRKSDGTVSVPPAFAWGVAQTTWGNTLMFQTMPTVAESNPLRLQTMHGDFLLAAMCDGSVRSISSKVSRREPMTPNATGRVNFGDKAFSAETRGAKAPTRFDSQGAVVSVVGDGVWDMLMMPKDPPGNVLPNGGQVGQTK